MGPKDHHDTGAQSTLRIELRKTVEARVPCNHTISDINRPIPGMLGRGPGVVSWHKISRLTPQGDTGGRFTFARIRLDIAVSQAHAQHSGEQQSM